MNLKDIFEDKSTKPKEKTELLSTAVLNGELSVTEVIDFAKISKDPVKASCIESLEFATQKQPEILDWEAFSFIVDNLAAKAPRIKWESTKVIGNTAKFHTENLGKATANQLENTSHEGTAVRWSAAYALSEILNLNHDSSSNLLETLKTICDKEEKNSIKKIYQKAIKTAEK